MAHKNTIEVVKYIFIHYKRFKLDGILHIIAILQNILFITRQSSSWHRRNFSTEKPLFKLSWTPTKLLSVLFLVITNIYEGYNLTFHEVHDHLNSKFVCTS